MIALAAESVTKRYRVRPHGPATLLDSAIHRLRGGPHSVQDVWALRDVTSRSSRGAPSGHRPQRRRQEYAPAPAVRHHVPTRGRVSRAGPVSGLLELGGGFQLDCTGRQNLMTAGLLAGLTAAEVRARYDEIVAFAELEDAIDRAVRTYSSGMYLRLAFAAAVHFDPRHPGHRRGAGRGRRALPAEVPRPHRRIPRGRRTLVLTSHVPEQIKSLCDDVLVLDEGRARDARLAARARCATTTISCCSAPSAGLGRWRASASAPEPTAERRPSRDARGRHSRPFACTTSTGKPSPPSCHR